MQILEVNGRPATSNRYTIMLATGESVQSLDTSSFGPGSIAFTPSGDHTYRLDETFTWVEVVNSGSGGGTGGRAVYG